MTIAITATDRKKRKSDFFRRLTAFFVFISFTLLNTSNQVHAESLSAGGGSAFGGRGNLSSRHGANQTNPLKILGSFKLPEELGTVQEKFIPAESKSVDRLVIYLQDAHTNYDSESNIRKLIHFFQEKYGLPLVLLEGGEGKLDSLFFKSFPDEKLKEKILNDYLQKGELSGGEIASILNEEFDTDYYGIETQALYNENKKVFLEALQKEKEISSLLDRIESGLEQKAARLLSPPAKTFHEKEKAFHKESIDLIEYLKSLKALSVMLSRAKHLRDPSASPQDDTVPFPELQKILAVEGYQKRFKGEAFDQAAKQLIEDVQKILPRFPKEKRIEMGGIIQAVRTSQASPGVLVKQIEELKRETNLPLQIPEVLRPTAKHARTLSSIQGTKLFEELEALEENLRDSLPQSEEERRLLQEFRNLNLLKRLAKLELTRKEWEYLRETEQSIAVMLSEAKHLRDPSASPQDDGTSLWSSVFGLLSPHYRFYELARQRDEALFQNMNRLMEKKKAKLTVMVTGGFHSEGITQKLRESNTPFVLISPQIHQVGDKNHYFSVMQGKASYMRYFKGSLWDALAQDYTLKLLQKVEEGRWKAEGKNFPHHSFDLQPSTFYLLKRWRDRIIQNAIAEGKITEANSYTKYLDAAAQTFQKRGQAQNFVPVPFSNKDDPLKAAINHKLELFTAGLKEMWKTGDITPQSVEHLLNQMNTAPRSNLAVALALINDRPFASQLSQPIKSLPRAEVRASEKDTEIDSYLNRYSELKEAERRFGRPFFRSHWEDIKSVRHAFEALLEVVNTSWVEQNWKDLFELMREKKNAGVYSDVFFFAFREIYRKTRNEDLDLKGLRQSWREAFAEMKAIGIQSALWIIQHANLALFGWKTIIGEYGKKIRELKKAKQSLKSYLVSPNIWIREYANVVANRIRNAIAELSELKEAQEKRNRIQKQKEKSDRAYRRWEGRMVKIMQQMLTRYTRALREPKLNVETHISRESSIGSIQMGMSLGMMMEQKMEIALVPMISLHDALTIDGELALKHADKFIRALNFLIPHEVSHPLTSKGRGERFEIVPSLFEAAHFAALAPLERLTNTAQEVVVDRAAHELAVQIFMHKAKVTPTDLNRKEQAVSAFKDLIEIYIDYTQSEKGEGIPSELAVPHLARFEAEIRYYIGSGQIRESIKNELTVLADQLHEIATERIPEDSAKPMYDPLVEAYQKLFAETKIALNPLKRFRRRAEVRASRWGRDQIEDAILAGGVGIGGVLVLFLTGQSEFFERDSLEGPGISKSLQGVQDLNTGKLALLIKIYGDSFDDMLRRYRRLFESDIKGVYLWVVGNPHFLVLLKIVVGKILSALELSQLHGLPRGGLNHLGHLGTTRSAKTELGIGMPAEADGLVSPVHGSERLPDVSQEVKPASRRAEGIN